ncbi:hypothetical protein PMIN06_001099 [Paraphaeosphaeria minitans]|uniref:Short-chain dehydrogenase/reductase family oxidoreductase n=1 Tax=Paraphaeosphaeria minitans TaxID=565426 RepID=A0A9P6GPK0_9PLEO|nr:short-chain dehydrogenase/reductase family oxidoreductase [Paraphaeosphaeria minitans]
MPSTTYAEFGHDTEAHEVAEAFADGIHGKTIIVMGANSGGIGYTTLQAFASQSPAAQRNPRGATRIVNVTSLSPTVAGDRWSDINFDKLNNDLPKEERPNELLLSRWGFSDVLEKSYLPIEGYNQSKAANVLFSVGLSDRLYQKYGIVGIAVHPGIILTKLGRDFGTDMEQAVSDMSN